MSINKNMSMRRKQKDIFKLRSAKIIVQDGEKDSHYLVQFEGPQQTPYEKGIWKINLYLPDEYPYKSPSVGFVNKIFHPNIDYTSGSVCLDVINQTWTPMYELVNIFQIFLPQLLTYPNPASPLNHEAATLFEQDVNAYNKKVIEVIEKHALNQKFKNIPEEQEPTEQKFEVEVECEEINPPIMKANQQSIQIEEEGESEISDQCSLSQRESINDNEILRLY